jgi:hypothetical protein
MSFTRYLKMNFPICAIVSGAAFGICNQMLAGVFIFFVGLITFFLFGTELKEVVKLSDIDISPLNYEPTKTA